MKISKFILIAMLLFISCTENKERNNPLDPLSNDFIGVKLNSSKEIIYDHRYYYLYHFNNIEGDIVYGDNNNNLTIINSSLIDGLINNSIYFNGTNTYANLSNPIYLNKDYNSYIISFWVKCYDINTKQYVFTINSYSYNIDKKRRLFSIGVTNSKIEISYLNSESVYYSKNSILENKWNLITCFINNSEKTLILYINGQNDSTFIKNETYCDYIKGPIFYLGRKYYTPYNYFHGVIDEFYIMLNYNMSSKQIKQYYDFVKPD